MASQNLTRLNVALTMSTGAFSRATGSAIKSAEEMGSRLKSAILSPIGVITSALSAGAFIAGVKAAGDRIDGLAKSADRLGMSTEALAGFRLAAEQTGGSVEQMEQAMGKLQVKVEAALSGNKAAADSFNELGLSAQELGRLPIDQQMAKVSNAVAAMGTESQKTAAAVALFGESGGKMVGMLSLGSSGLEKAAKDAESMGLAISRVDAAKVEESHLAWQRIGLVLEGLMNKIEVKIAPFITALAGGFTDASKKANGFGEAVDNVIGFVISSVGFVADAWQGLHLIWQALKVGVLRWGGTLVDVADVGAKSAEWIGKKFLQFADASLAGLSGLWSAIKVGFAGVKIPVLDFVQFVAAQMANVLDVASQATMRFSIATGTAMLSAANSIRATTGSLGADARIQLEKNVAALGTATANQVSAIKTLFSDVEVTGSTTLTNLSNRFNLLIAEERGRLADLKGEELNSNRIKFAAAQIQAEAQLRAEARAAEIKARQDHSNQSFDIEDKGLQQIRFAWLEHYDWLKQSGANNTRQAMSQASNFFGNLAVLTQSSNKKAKAIGEAAARAKIVTDTASAAMGAYAALAGIPIVGPALGAAAAAAAIAAGAVQLSNVGKDSAGGGGNFDSAGGSSIGAAAAAPAQPNQTLVLQGDSFSAEGLVAIFKEAKEKGFMIDEVRRA